MTPDFPPRDTRTLGNPEIQSPNSPENPEIQSPNSPEILQINKIKETFDILKDNFEN
jgi:hypothetical protein